MARKTIIKKLPTVDNTIQKKRGRKPKVKKEELETVKEVKKVAKKTETKVKKETKKATKNKVEKVNKKEVETKDFVALQEKEIQKIESELQEETTKMRRQLAEKVYQQRTQVAQVKFRTKYMQLEHERQAWNKKESFYVDMISKLKSLAMQYAPLDEVFEVSQKITEISKRTNNGKKPLEMPE